MPVPPSDIKVIRPRADPSLIVDRFRAINPNNVSGDSQQSGQISIDQVKAKGLLILLPGPLAFDTLFTDPSSGRKLALPKWNGRRAVAAAGHDGSGCRPAELEAHGSPGTRHAAVG
jgi:hypothetical protein